MNEHETRKTAILRQLAGEPVTQIVHSIKKTRRWFYYWKKRFNNRVNDLTWFIDESKAPKNRPSKLCQPTEQLIVNIRTKLDGQQFAQTGAIAIQHEFFKLHLDAPPVWTINRVIVRNKLPKSEPLVKVHLEYPKLFPSTQQMDLVGPRYIKGDGRYYGFNMIDIQTHTAFIKAIRTKESATILGGIAEFWSEFEIPEALQMDNELAFRGSNRYPRSYGSIVRFALSQGVAPVFIPIREPWRNGMIEQFNHTLEKKLLTKTTFGNFGELEGETKRFSLFHNENHRYSSQKQKTPNEMSKISEPGLKYNGTIHQMKRIPLQTGTIYFIRLIRSDLILHLSTEKIKVSESLKYSYVVAEVNLDLQSLCIKQNHEVVDIFPFTTPLD